MLESSLESEFRETHRNLETKYLNVSFANCPVEESLGVLGKKWTMLIVRDIGVYGRDRFNRLQKSLPRIPPKVLATRLKQLEKERFVSRYEEKSTPPKVVRWSLTEKGLDALKVDMMLAVLGAKWNAERVFFDRRARKAHEIFNPAGMDLLTEDL